MCCFWSVAAAALMVGMGPTFAILSFWSDFFTSSLASPMLVFSSPSVGVCAGFSCCCLLGVRGRGRVEVYGMRRLLAGRVARSSPTWPRISCSAMAFFSQKAMWVWLSGNPKN